MPVNSANQGIPEQQGADPANLPSAQVSWDGVMENRLVQRYTNDADRTARRPAPNENEISVLASEDRADIYNSASWVSLYARSVRAVRMSADQALTVSSTVLQNITALVVPVEANGVFQFELVAFYDGPAAGDIKFAITGPAGATAFYGGPGQATTAASNIGDIQGGASASIGGSIAYGTSAAGTGNLSMLILKGEMTTVGTAGNLQVQAAQNTADAGTTTVRTRSRLHVWRAL